MLLNSLISGFSMIEISEGAAKKIRTLMAKQGIS